jgi:flavin reductase (DIM6/NTAB) family NADH-FMN oxidoreductase RutF
MPTLVSTKAKGESETEAPMAQETFADVLRKFPQAVSVVTVGRGGVENALTVAWASPVSFDPPQMMISVDRLHYSADFLRSTRNFCLNVLRDGQQRLAGQFARQTMANEDKTEGVPTRESETGAAILTDALAYFDCEISSIHETGDHLMVVGRVVDAGVLGEGAPLTMNAALRYQKARPGR